MHVLLSSVQALESSDTSCTLIDNYLCSNSPDSCSCSESELNCDVCQDSNDVPCSKCIDGYFLPKSNYKCTNCQTIFGNDCLHCANFLGCQQCADNKQRYKNSCGLYTCSDTITTENQTDRPVVQPTESPLTDLEKSQETASFAQLFWSGENCELFREQHLDSAKFCYAGFDEEECFARDEFIDLFCGVCDVGFVDNIANDRAIGYADGYRISMFEYCRSCVNSQVGLFSMNFKGVAYWNLDSNKIDSRYIVYKDEQTVEKLKEIVDWQD